MSLKTGKLVCNITNTQYPIISEVVKTELNWKTSEDESEKWDVMWTDSAVSTEQLSKMDHFQRINHFPGMYLISRKNNLAISLKKLQKHFPEEFSFFPRTWILPYDFADLKFNSSDVFYIVKPEASSQGRGIFLTKRPEDLNFKEKYVVQEYISNPLLMDDFKFDLRVYALITSCDPLRIFVFEEGLTRLASEQYVRPNKRNMDDVYMHLTNYAINKTNHNFVNNKDVELDHVGHKRSLNHAFQYISELGHDVNKIIAEIDDIIIKTLCSIKPNLSHNYLACQPDDLCKAMCFEILGFDILLNENLKPYLLEVNHSPSFNTDSPLDRHIKKHLILDSLKLAWVSRKQKCETIKRSKIELNKRVLCGKVDKIPKEEKEKITQNYQDLRDLHEKRNLGKFRKIYPAQGSEKYDKIILQAEKEWNNCTGSKRSTSQFRSSENFKGVVRPSLVSRKPSLVSFESDSSVFSRLSKPATKKISKGSNAIFPGIVYEDKSLYKYELPRQIVLSNEKTIVCEQKILKCTLKTLKSLDIFQKLRQEHNKTQSLIKFKCLN